MSERYIGFGRANRSGPIGFRGARSADGDEEEADMGSNGAPEPVMAAHYTEAFLQALYLVLPTGTACAEVTQHTWHEKPRPAARNHPDRPIVIGRKPVPQIIRQHDAP